MRWQYLTRAYTRKLASAKGANRSPVSQSMWAPSGAPLTPFAARSAQRSHGTMACRKPMPVRRKCITNIRSQDYSIPIRSVVVPMMEFRSRLDHSFPGTFVPWNIRSIWTFWHFSYFYTITNVRSNERMFQGWFFLGNECSMAGCIHAASPKLLGPSPTYTHTVWRRTTKFCVVWGETCFRGPTTPLHIHI